MLMSCSLFFVFCFFLLHFKAVGWLIDDAGDPQSQHQQPPLDGATPTVVPLRRCQFFDNYQPLQFGVYFFLNFSIVFWALIALSTVRWRHALTGGCSSVANMQREIQSCWGMD